MKARELRVYLQHQWTLPGWNRIRMAMETARSKSNMGDKSGPNTDGDAQFN